MSQKSLLLLIITLCLLTVELNVYAADIKIGLRANRGTEIALKRWQATADYLNQQIPEHRFILLPFEINAQLNQAVSRNEFDFILTNPAAYVEQNIRYGVSAIATLINKRKGKGYTQFGSVIITRADRNDINTFEDLRGKSFMGADEIGFGGWRVAWREFKARGVDPFSDFSVMSFGGGIQQNVVFAVRDGEVDAGSVRTDLLERMAKKGEIDISMLKAIEPRKTENFEFLHSSRLYPEWPFAKAKHTSDDLARHVAAALYNVPANSQAAKNGKYVGWTVPLDYAPVDELLRELSVGPYIHPKEETLLEFLNRHWQAVILTLILFTVIVIVILVISNTNRRLKKAHNELESFNKNLEHIIDERTANLKASNQELESYSYTIAHDLRAPLRTLSGFSQILAEEASSKLNKEELDSLNRIESAGKKMAVLIDEILDLSRITRMDFTKSSVNISEICKEIAKNLGQQSKDRNVTWKIQDNIIVSGDKQLLYIMLQNLLENAWKFTRKNPASVIEVGTLMKDGTQIIYIKDNGVGFNMKYVEKVFLPFQQLHPNEFDGTGVGLASVHRIIQRHGGEIWAEANPDEGATFYIKLNS